MAKKQKRLSAADFARLRGVSGPAVGRAIRSGRLSKSVRKLSNGRYSIDPELGIVEWDANTMAQRRHSGKLKKPKFAEIDPTDPLAAGADAEDEDDADDGDMLEPAPGIPAQTISNAVAAKWKAKKAQLDFELLDGKLVYADQAEREYFRAGRTARDAMINIAERISAELAADTDPDSVYRKLTEAILEAMEGVTDASVAE